MSMPTRARIAGAVLPAALILGACGSSSATNASLNKPAASSTHANHAKGRAHKHRGVVGIITVVSATSLTLREHTGAIHSFALSPGTKIRTGKGASGTTLVVGERVRVLLATGSVTTAKAVVIMRSRPAASPSG